MKGKDMNELGHIGVLLGGCSSERDISFKSGKAVIKALSEKGCLVSPIEIESTDESEILGLLKDTKIDVAFIALHGEFGEDGGIQAILEKAGIPYTGSDVATSRITINKILTQRLLKQNGLLVPAYFSLQQDRAVDVEMALREIGGFPVVVKPAREGSSIGITIVQEKEKFVPALREAFLYGSEILVEKYVSGKEVTAGILDQQALPLVEIRPQHAFFDYEAKYKKGLTDYLVPADLPPAVFSAIQEEALKAFKILGCRDLARIDFIVDAQGRGFILEVNTIPGFTETSLLPKAAKYNRIEFWDLCLQIVQLALNRKGQQHFGKNCCLSRQQKTTSVKA